MPAPAPDASAAVTTPTPSAEPPSRRGLLHGLAAAGALVAGASGSALALTAGGAADRATAATALDPPRHGHRHKHRHRHRHRHKHPTPSPTPTPTAGPTTGPVPAPTTAPTTAPPTIPTPDLLDDPAGRHLVSRFGYGLTPALAAQVQAVGGGAAWFAQQLDPDAIADDDASAAAAWWPSLARTPSDIWQRNVATTEYGWQVMQSYERWLLMRRVLTQRPVQEVLTEFWENHLNVPVGGDGVFTWRTDYGQVIRRHALGRFDELLVAAVTHPAMLTYLNGAISTKAHPNENLGRELLELHTVGRGQYTEDDVKSSARILTGWHVDLWNTWAASYATGDHYVGPVTVMGFTEPNTSADGRDLTTRYLGYLAHHPATARRIATKLAVRFCRDDPSDALLDDLAGTYLASGTDITAVLLALVGSAEFAASAGQKVRMPCEDVVATYRALGVQVAAPAPTVPEDHVVNAILWQCDALGAEPHNWPQPNGSPTDNASWSSPSRMVASLGLHWSMSGGWWPRTGATYRAPADWLPGPSTRFDTLVDHLSRQVLLRRATPQLVTACCQAVGLGPAEPITSTHPLVRWNFPRLLATLLDSPAHLTR